eukprot:857750-Pelagomonas_calceolata.AAC.7
MEHTGVTSWWVIPSACQLRMYPHYYHVILQGGHISLLCTVPTLTYPLLLYSHCDHTNHVCELSAIITLGQEWRQEGIAGIIETPKNAKGCA